MRTFLQIALLVLAALLLEMAAFVSTRYVFEKSLRHYIKQEAFK